MGIRIYVFYCEGEVSHCTERLKILASRIEIPLPSVKIGGSNEFGPERQLTVVFASNEPISFDNKETPEVKQDKQKIERLPSVIEHD